MRVILTNGCFDLLHVGHVGFLETGRALGNVLIVGLNIDASIRRRKVEAQTVASERIEPKPSRPSASSITSSSSTRILPRPWSKR